MTEADKIVLESYVRQTANRMGLIDWRFEIRFGDDLPKSPVWKNSPEGQDGEIGALASCLPIPGARRAVIEFSPEIRNSGVDEIAEVVCHELTHCHLADLYEHGRTALVEHIAQQTYDVFMYGFALAWEHAIDGIAYAWAKDLPKISWLKEAKK